ncbi:hypothetical protein [Allofustis seminis]|uniref:hypothetical protein n=1 Tax=Allofustis seminis TaxID=166939 RepID=UPI0003642001|nr:hypothetical protein [Allofustis seminis]
MKKKTRERWFSGLSALVMCLSILPVNALATEETQSDDEDAALQGEVNQESTLGHSEEDVASPAEASEETPSTDHSEAVEEVEAVLPTTLHEAESTEATIPAEVTYGVAKARDGKYYKIIKNDPQLTLMEIIEEEYNQVAQDSLMTIESESGSLTTGALDSRYNDMNFTVLYVKDTVGFTKLNDKLHSSRDSIIMTLHKDWVLEEDESIDALWHNWKLDGQNHRIYKKGG